MAEDKTLVSDAEITAAVDRLEGWSYDASAKSLVRIWPIEKFVLTMGIIRRLTEVMDQENHHSDLILDGRARTLTVRVTTFSENAVTKADLKFAEVVNQLGL